MFDPNPFFLGNPDLFQMQCKTSFDELLVFSKYIIVL